MKPATFASCLLAAACCILCIAAVTSRVGAQETAAGGYKIGVVDMREVFQKYERRESQFQKLLGERDTAQAKVDALAEKINAAQKNYLDKKQTLSADALDELEMQILSDVSSLDAERKKLQTEVSLIEDRMLKDLTQEIRVAIAEIGQSDNFHLILESGSQSSTVLYSATPLSITSKVIDRLNKKAS